jgi:Protein of unknown function (DUF2842)
MALFASSGADHIVGHPLPQSRVKAVPVRLRKLIGGVALIVLVVTWALVAMVLAQAPAIKGNRVVEVIYYVVAGLGWALPGMLLVKWMSGDGERRSEDR